MNEVSPGDPTIDVVGLRVLGVLNHNNNRPLDGCNHHVE